MTEHAVHATAEPDEPRSFLLPDFFRAPIVRLAVVWHLACVVACILLV